MLTKFLCTKLLVLGQARLHSLKELEFLESDLINRSHSKFKASY